MAKKAAKKSKSTSSTRRPAMRSSVDRSGVREAPVVEAQSKTDVQVQAERIAEKYFTDMMSAAGMHVDRMALEVLYWLPRDFLTLYQELYMRALRNTDGGAGGQGEAAAQTGALGKAKATTATNGKRFKKYWTVQDEHVLDMKGRVDRRLRSIARDMHAELEELDWKRSRGEGKKHRVRTGGKGPLASCPECKVIVSLSWRYCARCGIELAHSRAEETKMKVEQMRNSHRTNRDV